MSPIPRRLRKRELADVVATMNDPVELDAASFRDADLLLVVLGFEDRALAVPRTMVKGGIRSGATAVIRYETNIKDNEHNWPELEAAISGLCDSAPAELRAGPRLAHELRALLKGLPEHPRVVLDISVASNDLILEALGALLDSDIYLELVYAEAQEYLPTKEEFEAERSRFTDSEQMGLDGKVLDVTVAGEFSGAHSQLLPHQLVVFPGFSRDRVRATISKADPEWIVEPSRAPIVWMVGRPLHADLHWRRDAVREIHDLAQDESMRELSTFDYRETLRSLDQVYSETEHERNLTISALGSKMQAVGIALFCAARPDVRVLLARPQNYNASAYTRGTRVIWSLSLGSMRELSNALRRVGTLELTALPAD
jgi:hypothetical protein